MSKIINRIRKDLDMVCGGDKPITIRGVQHYGIDAQNYIKMFCLTIDRLGHLVDRSHEDYTKIYKELGVQSDIYWKE